MWLFFSACSDLKQGRHQSKEWIKVCKWLNKIITKPVRKIFHLRASSPSELILSNPRCFFTAARYHCLCMCCMCCSCMGVHASRGWRHGGRLLWLVGIMPAPAERWAELSASSLVSPHCITEQSERHDNVICRCIAWISLFSPAL